MSTAERALAKRSSASRSAPGRAAVSASSRIRSSPGRRRSSSASSRCVPGADARELDGAALGARLGKLDGVPAVMAVEPRVAVQRERDVAASAAPSHSARAAVDRARDAAPVEEENRAAAALLDRGELREKRRRQRIPGLATEVDELDRRHRSADPSGQLEPLEARPALRARRRAAVDGDRALERRPLRRDRARVVARIRLLLERRVVLLVDDDEAEPRDRREDRGASAHDDRRLSGRRCARARHAAPRRSARSGAPRPDRRTARGTVPPSAE